MAKGAFELLSFNRGLVSRLGLARVDLKRLALSAEVMTNWMPRVLGSMMLRPGFGYIRTLESQAKMIPFIFASDDTAIVGVRDGDVTITIADARLQRAETGAAVTNGSFDTNLTGWTQPDAGTVNAWQTGGYAGLAGDGTNIASLQQQVTVSASGTEHALRVVIKRGPVVLRVGSTANGVEYINDYELGAGWHSLAFTPTGASFYVRFYNRNARMALVDSCNVEAGGVVYLTAPWSASDQARLRWAQSGDIIVVACEDKRQHMIMRRAARSWSVQEYLADDGPFKVENTTSSTLAPSGLTGNITVTSSSVSGTGVFRSTHVGALFRLTSVGQTVADSFTSANDFSTHIRVIGVGETRRFSIVITGTFVANITLQRSFDEGASWGDVGAAYTVPTNATPAADGLDNQIVWYRIGIKTGDYTSGTAVCTLVYQAGSITGVVRVTGYTSSTSVSAEVLAPLGGTTASSTWAEGEWSDFRGWPSAVAFHDGRLFWAGKDRFWGSVTDQFYTFDSEFEGDAGPINRSIGYGPVDSINWLVSLKRLIAGTDGSEITCQSSSFNEPLTPTNFTPKDSSNQGSARVAVVKIDNKAIFVQRNGRSVYEIAYDVEREDYVPDEMTKLVPDVGAPGVVALAVQRKPDTRVHAVLSDGTCAVMVFDRLENVVCWVKVETDGLIVDACVLPGGEEDAVYYEVKRTLPSGVVNYIMERWALESEARGGAINKVADSFVYAAAASNTITNLSHLEGETVIAFGGGLALGSFVVSAGSITLHATTTYANRCAGLPYSATLQSSKLAYSMPGRSGLTLKKKIDHLGVILADTHPQGLEYGPSFERMDPLPQMKDYAELSQTAVMEEYDGQPFEFPGEWSTDARLCLRATAPKACTVLAAIVEMETNR